MEIDEDEDFYAPDESEAQPAPVTAPLTTSKNGDELEEGEEEDEGGEMDEDEDSDVDIIVENKDASKPAPPSQSRYSEIRNIPQRSTASETITKGPIKKEEPRQQSRTGLPPVSVSKVDVNAIPVHKQTGKPITQVNIDEDLTDADKPWRKPGTDLSDYFNYGFDEFTWALYAQKQEALRGEYSQEAVAQNNKKMMEDMTNMMMMGGMIPGMAGASGAGPGGAASAAAITGMESMSPEMQQMMQQMISSGFDPSQMDPAAMAMYSAGGAAGAGNQGGQVQSFGAGFGGNQAQAYGYDQQMSGTGGAGGGGGGGGRAWRGRRR